MSAVFAAAILAVLASGSAGTGPVIHHAPAVVAPGPHGLEIPDVRVPASNVRNIPYVTVVDGSPVISVQTYR